MRILVACEESQAVTIEMRKQGHEAYSCDIEPCSGGHPEWHIQGDVTPLLKEKWDMIIAFPPCTYLTTTGNRWFNVEKYGEKAITRQENRKEAIDFFLKFANADCDRIAIENPWMFGDPFEKKTCLWLKGLPLLTSSNPVEPPPRLRFESGRSMPEWYAEAWKLPKDKRAMIRSKTFPGFAKAMAEQWAEEMAQQWTKGMK